MKKDVILEALKNAGVELEDDKLKEFIKAIQVANGEDIENAKKDYATKEQEIAELKGTIAQKEEELKKVAETNVELEDLRKFKADVIGEQKRVSQSSAIEKLIGDEKYNFDKKAIKLLSIASKDKFVFNENNEITNADEVMQQLTTDYADYVVSTTVKGSEPADVVSTKTDVVDDFIKGFNEK